MNDDIVVRIDMDAGIATCLWTDELDLLALGRVNVERASNIEFDNELQAWTVARPDGTRVGPNDGFRSRADALAWEHEWANGELMKS